jgi:cyanophycin synthetase
MKFLQDGALAAGRSPEHIHLIAGEAAATAAGLAMGQPGDLIVITPTDVKACWQQVNEFKPALLRAANRGPLVAAE